MGRGVRPANYRAHWKARNCGCACARVNTRRRTDLSLFFLRDERSLLYLSADASQFLPIDSSPSSRNPQQLSSPLPPSQNPTAPARTKLRGRMDGGAAFPGTPPVPRSPEDVFRDYRARQAGLIRALTTGNARISFLRLRAFLSPSLRLGVLC